MGRGRAGGRVGATRGRSGSADVDDGDDRGARTDRADSVRPVGSSREMPGTGADLDARDDPPTAQIDDDDGSLRAPSLTKAWRSVGGDRGIARGPEPAQHAPHARGRMVSSESAPAAGWATTTCPPGPALDAARILDGGQALRRTLAAGRARRRRRAPRCRRRQGSGSRAGRRARPGEGRQRGEAEAEEGATVELDAGHDGGPAAQVDLARRWRSARREHEHAGVVVQRAVVGRPTAWRTADAAAVADGAVMALEGAPKPVLAERLARRGRARSSTPSETSTTSSSAAIVACAARMVDRAASSPRTGPLRPRARAARGRRARPSAAGARSAAIPATTRARPSREQGAHEHFATSNAQIASWTWAAASARSSLSRCVAR